VAEITIEQVGARCSTTCVFWCLGICRAGFSDGIGYHTDKCPGPGTYTLVRKEE
jgi:hypothetical protein